MDIECPWGTRRRISPHFLHMREDVSNDSDVQGENPEPETEEEMRGGGERRGKKDGKGDAPKDGGRTPSLQTSMRRRKNGQRERQTKKPTTFLGKRGFLRYGNGHGNS
ncbi:hypothetical protein NDU88_001097 [Pleurodeles waltl]|uniref:Uncharacterized protein n=1 Tax=Pleurodeles waltl TaxID=8319 RepID=A0AAV7R810_PLEWA|nr:hypothetical protein NDU88_001097 [Pleurodeles waltl]